MDVEKEIALLKEQLQKLQSEVGFVGNKNEELSQENEELKERVGVLESAKKRDFRKKGAKRVLGFTLSNVNGYYNAVRTLCGNQVRIYIGKDISDDEKVKAKIIGDLSDRNGADYWREEIESCELKEIPEIKEALKKITS